MTRIKNYLANNGFEFTDNKSSAELALDVNSNSEKGVVTGSIYITYASSIIRVSTVNDNKEIYATTLDRIKGFSLDYPRSRPRSVPEADRNPRFTDLAGVAQRKFYSNFKAL